MTNIQSRTIHLGGPIKAVFDQETGNLSSLEYEGDILWGRQGRYTTSFFLLFAVLQNRLCDKSFQDAMEELGNLTVHLKTLPSWNEETDKEYREALFDQLISDCQKHSKSSDSHTKIVEELTLRWLDIRVHLPYSFFETENVATDRELQKQRDALSFLSNIENRLKDQEQ